MTESTAPATTDAQSLRRLVNGVIWPGFIGTSVPSWLAEALSDGLAGVVYFSHNLLPDMPGQPAELSAAIRAANPLAVTGADEEGGNVTRLQFRAGSDIPGAAVLGALDDVTLTEAAGRAIGTLCRAAGINLVIGPVADVNTNPLNPVIGVRSFGSGTDLVSRHTGAMVRGIASTGVGACAKHFPGHGDTSGDSHLSLPRLDMTLDDVKRVHLPPFRAAAAAGAAAMMTAHIAIPDLGEAPATLNPAAGALLRGLGFDGLLITDALDMAAVQATVGMGQGAVQSLLAGADLLCAGNPSNPYSSGGGTDGTGQGGAGEDDYLQVRDALLAAVADGTLPISVLERAAARVAAFASGAARVPAADHPADPAQEPDWVAVAARACTVSGSGGTAAVAMPRLPSGVSAVDVVDLRTAHNMAAGATENFFAAALAERLTVRTLSLQELVADKEAVQVPPGLDSPSPRPCVVVLDALLDRGQAAGLAELIDVVPDAIAINAGLATPLPVAPPMPIINCFGSSRVSARAVARLLTAEDRTGRTL
ncbi:glycoside hydrolase family 3 N-terminal domain-containing protein [Arthrobacter sp. A5]|uniref:glycoside hydrolase family 3 N-terminal domain-containing protein n=1 Tax=Arthrobacter sp. A5 TaxID=576926 RepID=UPI003DA9B0D1